MEKFEESLKQFNKKHLKLRLGIFFGYNGKQYRGLQFSPMENIETVEKQLFKAMVDSGFVLPQHQNNVKEISWSRGARTDKGVHALINCCGVNFKLPEDDYLKPYTEEQTKAHETIEKAIQEHKGNKKKFNQKNSQLAQLKAADKRNNVDYEKIKNILNSNLPEDIKVYSLKPVTSGFNVRHAARSRKYEYYMPLKVFQSWADYQANKEFDEKREEETLKKIQELTKVYLGTKNFHNFTIKIKPKDPHAIRYMMTLDASLCQYKESQEKWVRFQLHGASFMYHQIRLMVGMMAKIFQKDLNKEYLENAFFQNHCPIWLAPAEGLFLNRILFTGYNKKGDVPTPLILTDKEESEVEKFRVYLQNEVILSTSKAFEEFVVQYNTMTDKDIMDAVEKEDKGKIEEEDE